MNFAELAVSRRSIRKFQSRPVEDDMIKQIIETTLTAPSSKNLRTTRIVVTQEPAIMETIAGMRSTGAAFVKDAPLAFFIMGDSSQTDLWRENASISATVLQLACHSMGLGSCWVQVFGRPHREDDPSGESAEDYLRRNISALPDFRIMCVVAAGYPEEEPRPRSAKDDSDKIFYL